MSRSAWADTACTAFLLLALPLACGGAAGAQSTAPPTAPPVPYRQGVQDPLEFRGPGRDDPDPDVSEMVLGWFGPGDPDHPAFGTLWRGAVLALEEANAAGGYPGISATAGRGTSGKPFRLEPAWSDNPWHAGIGALLRLVYERHAWAVIGGVDGSTTHLALQAALKSRFVLLTPGSTDPSTERANVPWLFSMSPSDDVLASTVVPALAARAGPVAVAASADHDGHVALGAFRRELAREHLTPAALVEFDAADDDLDAAVARLLESRPRSVLVLGPARSAGRFVASLRRARFTGTVYGSATSGSRAFLAAAGTAAEGTWAVRTTEPGPAWDRFSSRYERRWREAPDQAAAQAYDAVTLIIEAIRRAGLNRARILDAIRASSPWNGASGSVRWDAVGRNLRRPALAVWRGGQLVAPAGTAALQ